jgi:predicted RNase H-like HicB family nuclease
VIFTIAITRDEDGKFIAECSSIPGCLSQGNTEEEAALNIQDAIREALAVRARLGMPLTITTRQIEVLI